MEIPVDDFARITAWAVEHDQKAHRNGTARGHMDECIWKDNFHATVLVTATLIVPYVNNPKWICIIWRLDYLENWPIVDLLLQKYLVIKFSLLIIILENHMVPLSKVFRLYEESKEKYKYIISS